MTNMLCPDCNHNLSPVILTSSNQQVILDYCDHCGGIWTDAGETNLLDAQSLEELNDLLLNKSAPPIVSQDRYCPRDRTIMTIFRGEGVPDDLTIYKCLKCNGLWFPFHALDRWKNTQVPIINYLKQWQIPLPSIYSVVLPVLLLLILGSGLMAVLSGINRQTDVRIKAHSPISKPLVLHTEPNSVIISFNTEKAVLTKLKYWQRPNSKTETWVSNIPKVNHTVQLKNLNSGVTYSYQLLIQDEKIRESPIYTFTVE